jgi:hypothetical protein
MNKLFLLLTAVLSVTFSADAQVKEPLTLIRTMEMPGVPLGPYVDHFGVDVEGHRLFATPQAHKSVQVFDINTGKFIRELTGFGNAHGVVYRGDLDQLYVSDGGDAGEVKIFSGKDYHFIKSVVGLTGADSNGYDPGTKETRRSLSLTLPKVNASVRLRSQGRGIWNKLSSSDLVPAFM